MSEPEHISDDKLKSLLREIMDEPLTMEEAERALDEAEDYAVPLSEERIKEIVDWAIRGGPEKGKAR